MIVYRALTLLWHSAQGRYVEPGEPVALDHLDAEAVERLIAAGAVAPADANEGDPEDGPEHGSDQ